MSKGALIAIISCFSVVILMLVGVMVLAATGAIGNFTSWEGGEEVVLVDETWAVGDLADVEVKWHTGNVVISRSDDDNIYLKQTTRNDAPEAEVQKSGSRLYVRQTQGFSFPFIFFSKRSDLELRLPEKQYEEFTMSMSSGNVDISDMNADSITLKMSSGDMTAGGLSAKDVKITVTSGNMKLHGVESSAMSVKVTSGGVTGDGLTADTLETNITSGDVSLDGAFSAISSKATSGDTDIRSTAVPDSLNASLTSGRINIDIPENDGFKLSYKKTSGRISSDFDIMSSINNDYYVYGNGKDSGREYSVKIASGNFDLGKMPTVDTKQD